jgi:hypothetical protein
VAASQVPGPVTNTIGAMQGRGRLTLAWMVESPAGLAGKAPVVTLAMVAASLALMIHGSPPPGIPRSGL